MSKKSITDLKLNEPLPDLNTLTDTELSELLRRQNILLQSGVLKRLADKGEKVKIFKEKLEKIIEERTGQKDAKTQNETAAMGELHTNKLLRMQKEPKLPFQPYRSYVDKKISTLTGTKHNSQTNLIKSIELEQSLTLLSTQLDSLKIHDTDCSDKFIDTKEEYSEEENVE